MKRAFIVMFMLVAAAALAAGDALAPAVRDAIEDAIASEREAIARYEAYAAKAAEEGYAGAAALFRAQAQAERTHEARFVSLLEQSGVPVPPAAPQTPKVWSTGDNFRAAITAETAERDGTYRKAVETCREHGAEEVAKIFDQTRDSEVEHVNLCNAASRDLDSMKNAKTYYVCGKCGYTTDIGLPFCPACQRKEALKGIQ